MNKIFEGDCIDWLEKIEDESVDLCYIDPPFFTQRDFRDFDDRHKSIDFYINYIRERITLIHKKLKPTGNFFLHCDDHAKYHLKLVLDAIFCAKNFKNEIIWCYKTGGSSKKKFSKKHDTIFFYSKNFKTCKFFCLKEKSYLKFKYGFKNIEIKKDDHGFFCDVNMRDVWDLPALRGNQKENFKYATQKPEALLERIIACSTEENDVVLDCFAGSFTTAAVAQKMNRRFICGDLNPRACEIGRRRLEESGFCDFIFFTQKGTSSSPNPS